VACNHAKAGIIPAAVTAVAEAAANPIATKAVAEPGPLPLVQIATAVSPADAVYRQTSTTAAWTLLGVAFSMMAALNLAVVRHLKRAYATSYRPVSNRKIG
jgi:ABC-type nitrate/sulfonate/bicarbonate transport system permease component